MKIGIVCYASVGGSGVVATELAYALAQRGHDVHVLSAERPFRWRTGIPGLTFEPVDTPAYPLFHEPQYLLALATAIVRVSREHQLDIVHAHYAVPHATAAYLARQMLASGARGHAPRTVTTLHGTDITLVGSDPSYTRVVAFSIEQSHGVTAVSESLKRDTASALGVRSPIRVVPNFLNCADWGRTPDPETRAWLTRRRDEPVVVHVSNFRPVKRVGAVLDVFSRLRRRVPCSLAFIGDGPDRPMLERRVAEEGLGDSVRFVGERRDLARWLSSADLFLLPSAQESFGLAALEAMACGVAVVASNVGGLPEVIEDGVTGYVCPPEAVDAMAERGIDLLTDEARRARMTAVASARISERYCADRVVPQYEAYYSDVLAGRG